MKKKARNSGDNDVDAARSAQMALSARTRHQTRNFVRKALHAAGPSLSNSTTRNYLDRLIWYSPASPFAPAMPT